MRLSALLLAFVSCFSLAFAAEETPAPEASEPQLTAHEQQLIEILKGIHYTENAADLPGGLASLNLPTGYRYISAADAKKILVDLWGNPPQTADHTLGMIVPAGVQLGGPDNWAIVATFDDQGYVSDKDADSLDYGDLLKTLKEQNVKSNEMRQQNGFETLSLIDWALPPHYDKEHRVLYWAKHYLSGSGENALNYDMRVLGRRGVLSLQAIAGMDQVKEVEAATPLIVGMVKFNEGHRYADFNPKTDSVSKLGMAGLILGGTAVAAKTGLLKGLIAALLAAKKLVIVGVVAVVGGIKKFFGKKNEVA